MTTKDNKDKEEVTKSKTKKEVKISDEKTVKEKKEPKAKKSNASTTESTEKKTRTKNVYYTKIEDKLKERLGYKVKLDSTNKHQRMIIEYNDDEGLESLLSLLDIDL